MKKKMISLVLLFSLLTLGVTGCGENARANYTDTVEAQAQTREDTDQTEGTDQADGADETEESEASEATDEYEPASIRIGVGTSRTPHLTALVAKAEGIYDKYNLDVRLVEFSAGIDTINAIELGQVDVGYCAEFAGLNRIGNLADPNDSNLRFIGRLERTATIALYVNPDKIKTLSDLKDKKIALQLGTVHEYYNLNALHEGGLTIDDVDIVSIDSAMTALGLIANGDVDAAWVGTAKRTDVEGYGFVELVNQADLGLYQTSLFVTSDAYSKSDAETIVRFLKATKESYDFIAGNFDAAVADIVAATGMESDVVADSLNGTTLLLDLSQETYDALVDMDKWLIENEYYSESVDFEQYLIKDFIREAVPDADIY